MVFLRRLIVVITDDFGEETIHENIHDRGKSLLDARGRRSLHRRRAYLYTSGTKFCSCMGGRTYFDLSSAGNFIGLGVRSSYGIIESMWWMTFRRAHFLLSAFTTYHGTCLVSVWANISSLAREYSTQRGRDCKSIGLNFQRLVTSAMRSWKRRSCSSSLTENQYLIRMIPERTSMRSNSGQLCRNSMYSLSVQNPITRSTPARLYQLRSNSTISPAAGRWATYLWKYHCVVSRSVGVVRATTR